MGENKGSGLEKRPGRGSVPRPLARARRHQGAAKDRLIDLFLTAGPVGDYIGAHALVSGMPNVKWLLGDRGYDADWFREAVQGTDPKASKASKART